MNVRRHSGAFSLRTGLSPGDLGAIVRLHGVAHGRVSGGDATFEALVAGPLSEFAIRASPRERIRVAEGADLLAGSIAVVEESPETAQLRWFIVEPACRGAGLGRAMLAEAIAFAANPATSISSFGPRGAWPRRSTSTAPPAFASWRRGRCASGERTSSRSGTG